MYNLVIAAGIYWGLVYVLYDSKQIKPLRSVGVLMDVDR